MIFCLSYHRSHLCTSSIELLVYFGLLAKSLHYSMRWLYLYIQVLMSFPITLFVSSISCLFQEFHSLLVIRATFLYA